MRLLTFSLAFCAAAATACAEEIGGLDRKDDRPLEQIAGVTSHYGSVDVGDGARLRTIIAAPDGADAPLHPVLFTQWVSCGSIEYREGSGSREILAELARSSGLALVRVERSPDGDSIGPACDALDYDTEIAHYLAAFKEALQDDRIDAGKVYVYGSSLGSTTAPLIAKVLQDDGYDIAGIAVQGGGAETYYERMLTFERHYLERRPDAVAPEDIHDELIARAKFNYEYLINDRHPDDVAKDSPAMATVRNDTLGLGETNQYGRPFAWHQQAAKKNFLAAWAAIEAPVLVIFNEFDQFEAQYGADVIVNTVNRLRPETAMLVTRPNIGHSDNRYPTIEDAYAFENGEPAWEEHADILVEWFKER
ncbi:MAG: hypothetical protein AAFW81_01615 [Pseudomonadota bacterium]